MNKMNQSQTRSPRKRLLSLILAVILMIGLCHLGQRPGE